MEKYVFIKRTQGSFQGIKIMKIGLKSKEILRREVRENNL